MNPAIGTVEKFDLSQEFIGIILLPIIGNAAEHYTAITVAMRNKMDLALGAGIRAVIFFLWNFGLVVFLKLLGGSSHLASG